jgi:hypothetical protein
VLGEVALDLGLEPVEAEEQLAERPQLGPGAAAAAARVAELVGVQRPPAGVALVAAGGRRGASGAGALDVAVGQRAPLLGAPGRAGRARLHEAAVRQGEEQPLGDPGVVGGGGPGVVVEADADPLEARRDPFVLGVGEAPGGHAGPLGGHGDRRAVLVGAGHHQHLLAGEPVVAGGHVGRQVGAGQVAEMAGARRVGPGDADEDVHGADLLAAGGGTARDRRPPRWVPVVARARPSTPPGGPASGRRWTRA